MNRNFRGLALVLSFTAAALSPLSAQTAAADSGPVMLEYGYDGRYTYTERINLSQYVDGKYIGLTHREIRADVGSRGSVPGGTAFSGFFYVSEETLRDLRNVSLPLEAAVPVSFTVNPDGTLRFQEDHGYPRMRNFPAFPEEPVRPGDYWEAEAVRIVDPKNSGNITEMPVYVAYTFTGTEEYRGRLVHRIRAKYATRMGKYGAVRSQDPDLVEATGTHDADILVDAETGLLRMVLDKLDETFLYRDGGSIRFRGSSAAFTELAAATESGVLPGEIARIAEAAQKNSQEQGLRMPESRDDVFPDAPEDRTEDAFPPSGSTGPGGSGLSGTGADSPADPDSIHAAALAAAETAAQNTGGESGTQEPFTVSVTEQGIRLSVRDIRFQPDSDEILPEEAWRLDAIAETLRLAEGYTFLIEGHTASVGKPAGEQELSVRRAKKTAAELTARGIPADRFLYTGYGGTRPVADNRTAGGRAQNRRVEITILGAD